METIEVEDSDDALPALIRWWWVLLIGVVVGAGCGFGITRAVTPEYEASATQLVKSVAGTGAGANYQSAQHAVARAKAYPSFIYNLSVLQAVSSDLGGKLGVEEIRKMVSAENPIDMPIIRVTARSKDPDLAKDLANSAATQLGKFIVQIEKVGEASPVAVETAVQASRPLSAASPSLVVFVGAGAGFGLALGAFGRVLA